MLIGTILVFPFYKSTQDPCHNEEFGNSSQAVLLPQSLCQKKLQGKEYFCNFTNLK